MIENKIYDSIIDICVNNNIYGACIFTSKLFNDVLTKKGIKSKICEGFLEYKKEKIIVYHVWVELNDKQYNCGTDIDIKQFPNDYINDMSNYILYNVKINNKNDIIKYKNKYINEGYRFEQSSIDEIYDKHKILKLNNTKYYGECPYNLILIRNQILKLFNK